MNTVVVVHDRTVAMPLLIGLHHAGHDVIWADDVSQAMDKIQRHNPEFVVTGHRPPRIDASAVVAAVRGNLVYRDLPVMLISELRHSDFEQFDIVFASPAELIAFLGEAPHGRSRDFEREVWAA